MNEWWTLDGGHTWRLVAQVVDDGRVGFNRAFVHLEPWQIVSYTLSVACLFIWLRKLLKADRPLSTRIRAVIFSAFRMIPWVNAQIKEEMKKARRDLEETIHQYDKKKYEFYKFLPEHGLASSNIIHEAELYKTMSEFSFYEGRVSGVIFADIDEEHRALLQKMFELFLYSDPLYPNLFPGCRKMEAEIVRIIASLLHGGPGSCGTVTSNDTESNMLACFAYRNRAFARGIRHPEMLVPITAHAAFDKAAKVLQMRIRHISVDKNQRVDVGAMKRAISNETCMLVASAPNYSFGTVDNIEAISELSQRYGIPLHVDASLGGFILSIMERCDFAVKSFDFRVPGVTSISCDVQKYGFAPIGTSLILYRDSSLLHYQYFCNSEWPGGIYMTPTLAGNRDGCAIALTWATLLYNGRHGYTERIEAIINTVREIRTGIEKCPHIQLLCESDVSTVVFTTRGLNVYALADRMNKLGWVLSTLQNPPAVHICVTLNHTKAGVVENFIRELNMACEDLVINPEFSQQSRTAAVYGMVSAVPDLVEEVSHMYLDSCYAMPLPPTGRTLSVEGRKKLDGHSYWLAGSLHQCDRVVPD
ncbi:Sphingosine-1-phosphate lyase [Dirofilaria immitis]|nr:Sphingosine-1-phosphate lyase [Dirofilaria immitis]